MHRRLDGEDRGERDRRARARRPAVRRRQREARQQRRELEHRDEQVREAGRRRRRLGGTIRLVRAARAELAVGGAAVVRWVRGRVRRRLGRRLRHVQLASSTMPMPMLRVVPANAVCVREGHVELVRTESRSRAMITVAKTAPGHDSADDAQLLQSLQQQVRRLLARGRVGEDVAKLRVGIGMDLRVGRAHGEVAPHAGKRLEVDLVDGTNGRLPSVSSLSSERIVDILDSFCEDKITPFID